MYLSQSKLVENVLTLADLNQRIDQGDDLNIMMGQTFDEGQPVDMIKYALFIMNLEDIIFRKGIGVKANWLLADHFITEINQDEKNSNVKLQIEKRKNYLRLLNKVFEGNIGFVLSSELSKSEEYGINLSTLLIESENNQNFKDALLEAVPEDRRSYPNAYRYPFEELATVQSMDTDIKVGPPYELHYDEPARNIAQSVGFNRYTAIHLTRSFPFGNPRIPLNITEEINTFGILPYKKGSKGLEAYRIDPLNNSIKENTELLLSTKNTRAIIDILTISEMARQRLEGYRGDTLTLIGGSFYKGKNSEALRNLAVDNYIKYIHQPLQENR
ncbi:MAG: hypothetical protein Q7R43_01940 [Candidatus Daviesbacteria bacterium]|nr:hypothetical protein [Candidatus Daviesbacteria bacterium]